MNEQRSPWGGFFRSRSGLVFAGFSIVAAFYLVTEHTAHFFAALPYLVFLACPLMMMFMMHGGHGMHGDHGGHPDQASHVEDRPPQQGGQQ